MAYCKYCGRELKEGEVCNCRQQTANIESSSENTKQKINLHIDGALEFLSSYIKAPNTTCDEYAKMEYLPLSLTLGIIFILFSGLAQLSIGIKIGAFQGQLFLFGILFGILLLLIPAILNVFSVLIFNIKISKKNLLYKTGLHTPFVSLMFIFTFIVGVISIKALPVMFVLAMIVFAVSMVPMMNESLPQNDILLRKVIAFLMIVIFILVLALLMYLEVRSIGESVIDYLTDSLFNFI